MPSTHFRKIVIPLFLLMIIGAFFIGAKILYAQQVGFGFEDATALNNIGTRDIRSVIISIINIFLGLLGIIAIIIILYGGYVYMTSAGDPNKIDKAKKILINGAIGLGIIFFSWAIATFVFRMFGVGVGSDNGGGGGGGGGFSYGALGRGIIESHYPERNQLDVPRNTMIVVTFKEAINPATIINDVSDNKIYGDCKNSKNEQTNCDTLFNESVEIAENSGELLPILPSNDVKVFTKDNKTFVFTPVNLLGNAIKEFLYTVKLKNTIKKAGGEDAFPNSINGVGYEWQFEVSTIIDITPPQVESIVPYPDDSADIYSTTATQATGGITVVTQPNTYAAAQVDAINTEVGGSPSATVSGSYSGKNSNTISVTINNGAVDATVNWSASTENSNLKVPVSINSVPLGNGLTLVIGPGYAAGNQWTFNVTAEVSADFLRIGSTNYKFVAAGASGNEINLGDGVNATAANIANKIGEQPFIKTSVDDNSINITATTAGSDGNNIALVYTSLGGITALNIVPMSDGHNGEQSQTVNGKKDEPRNVVAQINFNEAVNPITATGEVKIDGGLNVGDTLDAASFNIILPSINLTVGGKNYIAGSWVISNQYRTVEFITRDNCGVNSCGEDVYCLPTDSSNKLGKISIEAKAANLPTADSPLPLDGVVDMAMNSLDGNKNGVAVGPCDYYNENTGTGTGDNYLWSFWVNSKVDLTPPKILEIVPGISKTTANLIDPITIKFSKLMLNSTLKPDSGYADGQDHLSLIDRSVNPVGYWISSQNIDVDTPPDNVPDKTQAFIKHTSFTASANYRAEVGEGVRDLYQNCFMPAKDESGCAEATSTNRSCCNGVLTDADECLLKPF